MNEYTEALEWLVSGWRRSEVVADGESAGWFVAQRANTDEERDAAQRAGVIVAKGKQ